MAKNTSGLGRVKDVALVVLGWIAFISCSWFLHHPLEVVSLGMIARVLP